MIRLILHVLFPFAIALSGGTASAWYAIDNFGGFGTYTFGPWTAQPTAGTSNSDPYVRARVARSSDIPLGPAEGLSYEAKSDNEGNILSLSCVYRVEGEVPAARVWTIHAINEDGQVISSPARSAIGLHSWQIVRGNDGRAVLNVAASAQPGNWLALSGSGNFRLVLTLYDTPSVNRSSLSPLSMPQIHRHRCA